MTHFHILGWSSDSMPELLSNLPAPSVSERNDMTSSNKLNSTRMATKILKFYSVGITRGKQKEVL